MAAAGRLFCLRRLKREETPVVAHNRIGRLVTGIIAEKCQSLVIGRIVEIQFPNVNVAGATVILFVAFDEFVFAVGRNSFRLVINIR